MAWSIAMHLVFLIAAGPLAFGHDWCFVNKLVVRTSMYEYRERISFLRKFLIGALAIEIFGAFEIGLAHKGDDTMAKVYFAIFIPTVVGHGMVVFRDLIARKFDREPKK